MIKEFFLLNQKMEEDQAANRNVTYQIRISQVSPGLFVAIYLYTDPFVYPRTEIVIESGSGHRFEIAIVNLAKQIFP